MANRKFKMTAFARFILIMLLATPIAYMAASYYNGEDGIENIKSLVQGEANPTNSQETAPIPEAPKEASEAQVNAEMTRLNDDLLTRERELDSMHFENGELRLEIKDQKKELEKMKATIEELQARIKMMEEN